MENGRYFVVTLSAGPHVFRSNDGRAGLNLDLDYNLHWLNDGSQCSRPPSRNPVLELSQPHSDHSRVVARELQAAVGFIAIPQAHGLPHSILV